MINRTRIKTRYYGSLSLLALSFVATGAQAQSASPDEPRTQAPTATSETDVSNSNDIVVTASKREQKLRDVPSAITVLSGDELENLGVKSVRDYATLTPGLTLQDNSSPGFGKIFIRGLTTGDLQQSATTVYYVDDVPFTASSANGGGAFIAPDPELSDINRIEVLKGPQGTLYGASSLGGVIRLVSNQPDPSRFSGSARTEVTAIDGGGTGGSVSGTVNVPLVTDKLALRATGFFRRAPGYVDNIGTGTDNVNRSDYAGGRVALGWTPSNRLTVDLVGQLQNIDTRGPALQYDTAGTFTPLYGPRKYDSFFNAPTTVRYRLASLTAKYDTDIGQIIMTGAYLHSAVHIEADDTIAFSSILPILGLFGYSYPANTGVATATSTPLDKTTAELRFVSKRLGPIEFIAGGFYTHEHALQPSDIEARDMTTNTTLPGTLGSIISAPVNDTYEELSAFGNLTFYLADNLDLTGGVRYAHHTEDFSLTYSGVYYTAFLGGPQTITDHAVNNKTTYLATLRWRPTSYLSVFARAASGYRPGGPQTAAIIPPGAQTKIDPDTVWNYEVGIKGDFLDKKLSIEASVYHIDWKNIQLYTIFDNFQVLANAGKAKVDGFELQAAAKPTNLLTISGNVGYTNPRIAQVDAGVTALVGVVAGDRLPQSSRWTEAAIIDQLIPLGSNVQGQLGGTLRVQSSRNSSFQGSATDPNVILPALTTVDLRAGIHYRTYQLQFRVENVFNKIGVTNYSAVTPTQEFLTRPRTFTLSLNTAF